MQKKRLENEEKMPSPQVHSTFPYQKILVTSRHPRGLNFHIEKYFFTSQLQNVLNYWQNRTFYLEFAKVNLSFHISYRMNICLDRRQILKNQSRVHTFKSIAIQPQVQLWRLNSEFLLGNGGFSRSATMLAILH